MTKTKPTLDEILYEQGIAYILESDKEEFASFANDMGLNIEDLKTKNAIAAEFALNQQSKQLSVEPKGLFARSKEKPVLTHNEKVSLLKRLMASAKKLGFSCTFTMEDLSLFDEPTLEFHIAEFQSLLNNDSLD